MMSDKSGIGYEGSVTTPPLSEERPVPYLSMMITMMIRNVDPVSETPPNRFQNLRFSLLCSR